MHIIQLTPGQGNYYTGGAIRDHALVTALRRLGHKVSFVPLMQRPLVEEEEAWDCPLFYDQLEIYKLQQGGILDKIKALFMNPTKAARKIERMTPSERSELTLSLLQGKTGRQKSELTKLVAWVKGQAPDLVLVSNAMLMGLVPALKEALGGVPVIVSLQSDERALNEMPKRTREQAEALIREKAAGADALIAPSVHCAAHMHKRVKLPTEKLTVIPNGIALNNFSVAPAPPPTPTIGFLARMCEENGLIPLIKAFKLLRREDFPELQLRIGGAMSDGDLGFVAKTLQPLNQKYGKDIKILRNLKLQQKVAFLHSLSVLCVPSMDEAFGLYAVEAMAVGLPVVVPRAGGLTELIEQTGGGLLAASDDPKKLAAALAAVLKNQEKREQLAQAGRNAALEMFSVETMAGKVLELADALKKGKAIPNPFEIPVKDEKEATKKEAGDKKTADDEENKNKTMDGEA